MPRRVIAFLFRPDDIQIGVAQQWLGLAAKDITIYPIPQYRPETVIKHGDIIITFGTATKLIISSSVKTIFEIDLIHLPPLNLLQNTPTCFLHRKEARELLETIPALLQKEVQELGSQVVNIADLPTVENWETSLIALLNTSATRFLTARNGRKIQVGGEALPTSDIYLTVEELLMINKIMQTLRVKEVRFERPSND